MAKSNRRYEDPDFPWKEEIFEERKNHYISKKELYDEVMKCKAENKISEKLGKMFLELAIHTSRHPKFRRYKFWELEELQSDAVLAQIKAVPSFKPKKINEETGEYEETNAFAYFTEIVKNAFRAYLGKKYKNENFQRDLICETYHRLNKPFTDEIKKDMQETHEEQLKKYFEL